MRDRIRLPLGLVVTSVLLAVSCGKPAVEPQTLDEFIGWDQFDERAAEEAWNDNWRQIEEMTVACMAEKGLDYTAWIPPDVGLGSFLEESLSDSEWKLRYGYGFFAVMITEARWTVEHAEELAEGNPNWVHAEAVPEDVDYDYWVESWACQELAELEVRGEPDTELIPALEKAWSPLEEFREELQHDLENDPRLRDAREAWSACMAGQGYDFDTEEDIEDYLFSIGENLEEGALIGLIRGEISEAVVQPLADEELAIAAADVACRGDLDRLHEELRAEYEGKFIAEHREQLEKIRVLEQQFMQMLLEGKEPEAPEDEDLDPGG